MLFIIIIIKNEKIRVTLCENAAGALYIVNKMCVDGLRNVEGSIIYNYDGIIVNLKEVKLSFRLHYKRRLRGFFRWHTLQKTLLCCRFMMNKDV